ncbi:MAG: L-histidine N(alpha)-methyltransferase [Acidobacteriota bacterium]
MSVTASSLADIETRASAADHVAQAARAGLTSQPKFLPPWLFYDQEGSQLFDAITELDEYYLTRTERGILARYAGEMLEAASGGMRLRIQELGAGSADKTRLLLQAAVARQRSVIYEPIDVSASALDGARERIEREIPGVHVIPRIMDYTRGEALELDACHCVRRLVLYIGSSIGNFEPVEAERLLRRVRASLAPGDGLLLGVDLAKDEQTLLSAYDDAARVTAAFNRNLLVRLNRELGADFNPRNFAHRAVWNPVASRIEMYLESRIAQRVSIEALHLRVQFEPGETIHTENSYKYALGQAERLLCAAGFVPAGRWTDARQWFAVHLARAG